MLMGMKSGFKLLEVQISCMFWSLMLNCCISSPWFIELLNLIYLGIALTELPRNTLLNLAPYGEIEFEVWFVYLVNEL